MWIKKELYFLPTIRKIIIFKYYSYKISKVKIKTIFLRLSKVKKTIIIYNSYLYNWSNSILLLIFFQNIFENDKMNNQKKNQIKFLDQFKEK